MKDQLDVLRKTLRTGDKLSDDAAEDTKGPVSQQSNGVEARIQLPESEAEYLRKSVQELEIANSNQFSEISSLSSQLSIFEEDSLEKTNRISELDALLAVATARESERISELLDAQATINNLLDRATRLANENASLTGVRDHLLVRVKEVERAVEKYSELAPRIDELDSVLSKANKLELENSSLERWRVKHVRKIEEMNSEVLQLQTKLDRAVLQKKASKKETKEIAGERDTLAYELGKAVSVEAKLSKRLRVAESLNSLEFRVLDPFTVEWVTKNAIVSRDYELFFDDPKVLLTGSGPWDISLLKDILKFANRKTSSRKDKQVSMIVAGREDADHQLVEDMINVRSDQPIKVFTQELFIAAILAHQDPFEELSSYSNPEEDYPDLYDMVCRFGRGHPVIEHLQSQQFPWPDSNTIEDGTLNGEWAQVDQTPLVQMNYHVGELGLKMGLMERDRRDILKSAYLGDIPWVESDEYMATWGQPGTRQRLARIAYHLSMLIRSRKNLSNQIAARNNWQKDLDWLHGFYKPLMRFRWPS